MHLRRLLAGLMTVCLCVGLSGCLDRSDTGKEAEKADNLTVTIPATGASDCILITAPGCAVMIDTADEDDSDAIVSLLHDKGVTALDALIITHLDKDHTGATAAVLNAVTVRRLLQPDYENPGNDSVALYQQTAAAQGLTVERLTADTAFSCGNAAFAVDAPDEASYKDENNYSLITTLTYGQRRLLFAGDAEKVRLKEYLATDPARCSFLKMPHHGRFEKNLGTFLDTVKPLYAVVTSSDAEPAEDTVTALLKKKNIPTKYTVNGAVTVTTDGVSLTVTQAAA